MHMQAHLTGTSQCPLCPHPDETLDHLFHCPHPVLTAKREELLEHLRKKGLKSGTPRPLMDILIGLLDSYIRTTTPPSDLSCPLTRDAVNTQVQIGLQFLPRGFLSRRWIDAFAAHGCSNPHRTLKSIIYMLWIDFTDTLWRTRNTIAHDGTNLHTMAQERTVDTNLQWFITHYKEVLSHHDYKLVDHLLLTSLDTLSFRIKRQWLTHLETAKGAHATFLARPHKGQRLLTQYFQPMSAPHD